MPSDIATPPAQMKEDKSEMTQSKPDSCGNLQNEEPTNAGGGPNTNPQSPIKSSLAMSLRTNLDLSNAMDGPIKVGEDMRPNRNRIATESPRLNGTTRNATKSEPSTSLRSSGIKPVGNGAQGIPPHRSMLKALASRSSNENLRQNRNTSHPNLSDLANPMDSFAARFTNSPCLFHKRFDDAVNVDRVLEEIAAEEDGMSHSRLMQTATSVREISRQLQRRPIKRAVRTVMIVTKARDNRLVYLTRELAQYLLSTPRYNSELGITVYVDAKLAKSKRFDAAGLLALNPNYERMLRYWTPDLCCSSPEKFDLVLTLGGDGTVLYTSWLFQRIVPPILSFSLGTLGFLTNFAFPTYKPTLDRIMEGSGMRVNMRMRFTCTVYRSAHNRRSRTSSLASTATTTTNSPASPAPMSTTTSNPTPANPPLLTPSATFEVLNELVLDRGPSPYVSSLELYGDTHLLTIIQADGCIISTPTGSTAYSLSAGGPLCHPSIPGILLTPICPHTLSFRPMVLSDSMMLRLVVPKTSRSTAYASFDGKGRVELRRGDEVRVEAGRYPFPTVVGEGGEEWFESVRRALRWNTRGVVQGGWGGRLADEEEGSGGGGGVSGGRGFGGLNGAPSGGGIANGMEGLVLEEAPPLGSGDLKVGQGEGNDDDGEDEDEEEVVEWDIDADPIEVGAMDVAASVDSGLGGSVQSVQSSPAKKAATELPASVRDTPAPAFSSTPPETGPERSGLD